VNSPLQILGGLKLYLPSPVALFSDGLEHQIISTFFLSPIIVSQHKPSARYCRGVFAFLGYQIGPQLFPNIQPESCQYFPSRVNSGNPIPVQYRYLTRPSPVYSPSGDIQSNLPFSLSPHPPLVLVREDFVILTTF